MASVRNVCLKRKYGIDTGSLAEFSGRIEDNCLPSEFFYLLDKTGDGPAFPTPCGPKNPAMATKNLFGWKFNRHTLVTGFNSTNDEVDFTCLCSTLTYHLAEDFRTS